MKGKGYLTAENLEHFFSPGHTCLQEKEVWRCPSREAFCFLIKEVAQVKKITRVKRIHLYSSIIQEQIQE